VAIAAAVAAYINANPGIQMDAWLDVALPSESGTFKCQDGYHWPVIQLLRLNIKRRLEIVKTMGSKITKVTHLKVLQLKPLEH
jgi:hypothetical protein